MTIRPARTRLTAVALLPVLLLLAGCAKGGGGGAAATTTTGPAAATTTPSGSPDDTAAPGDPAGPAGDTDTTVAGPSPTAGPGTPTGAVPPLVPGLTVTSGAGSGEVDITWPPLPASAGVASYRLSKRKANGTVLPPATVTSATLGTILPGRLGVTDAPDSGPWPSMEPDSGPRCYTVSAVSTGGVEGPPSAEACGPPSGG